MRGSNMAFQRNICASLLLCAAVVSAQPPARTIVAISASGGDYLRGAGGTLAKFIAEGYKVYVIQVGNDEKNSIGLGPGETRLANNADGERAAKILGVTEIVNLNNKSGELSQMSSNELRNQLSILIRFYKPQKLFLPDPFIHYEANWDQFWTARAAEETNYSNSAVFLAELRKIGLGGHGVPETYYYAANRPYRPGEGGHNDAHFEAVDISQTFEKKAAACLELRIANQAYAEHTKQRLETMSRPSALLRVLDAASVAGLAKAWLEELAGTIGAKHGFVRGEEFNYHGTAPGQKRPVPPWIMERAKPGTAK
jgi:LmbE family N-acetylglucosaminyl deacetylase